MPNNAENHSECETEGRSTIESLRKARSSTTITLDRPSTQIITLDTSRPSVRHSEVGGVGILKLVFPSCWVSSTLAGLTIDTTSALTVDQWGCLTGNGLGGMAARVYTPDGAFDEVGIGNIVQSSIFNLQFYTAMIVPCVANCKNNLTSGADQVNAVIKRLELEFERSPLLQTKPNNFLIQIDKSNNWSTNQKQNQQLINDMLTALEDLTSGWTPFGGWAAPLAHQYAGGISSNNCAPGIPLNYSYFEVISSSKLRKDRKMTRRANTLKKFNRH